MVESSNPDSSQPIPPDVSTQMLAQGLAALKRQDYLAAVEHLQPLQTATTTSHRIKAQMGLVRAYSRLNRTDQALRLCQTLSQHPSPQVQAWAHQTLKQLTPAIQPPDSAPPQLQNNDPSGFVPLDTPPAPSARLGAPQPPPSAPAAPKPAADTAPDEAPNEAPDQATPDSFPPTASPDTSLFHYQHLNQAAPDSEGPTPPASTGAPAATTPRPNPRSLPPPPAHQRLQLWGLELFTAVVFYWVVAWLLHQGFELSNWLLRRLRWIRWPVQVGPSNVFAEDHSRLIMLVLLGLLLASPWLLDGLLQRGYNQQPWSSRALKTHSPDALRLLRRVCTQQGWQLPELRRLPMEAPVCFSYGWHPRNTRIVVSQGLLDRFSDEELTSLLAYEMSHLIQWDLPVSSGIATVLLLLYQAYWLLAQWGDRQRQPWLQNLIAALASLGYGLFWLLRKVGLWLSRRRSQGCDRIATTLTHQPHMHQQCLIKLTQATAATIAQQGSTPPLLESLDCLMPISQQLALSPGSSSDAPEQLFTLLSWDYQNPYRHWLLWNLPQLPTGERLYTLDAYATSMGLSPTLPTTTKTVSLKPTVEGRTYLPPLLLQGSPLIGALAGLAIGFILWFFGGISEAFNWFRISWFYQDASILRGFLLLGVGMGLMVRINRYFPDIKPARSLAHPDLARLQKNALSLPIDSQPVKLSGKLLGRSGIANWLCQDLILQTSSGLIRLHLLSGLGPLGNFSAHRYHPVKLVGRQTEVEGWFRRGPTAWLDVLHLRQEKRNWPVSNPPIWATLISLLACLWGLMILWRGY